MYTLDEICGRVAARAGVAAEPYLPETREDLRSAFGGHAPARILRVVRAGPVEAVVLSVPPGFRQRGVGQAEPKAAADLVARTISHICSLALPRRHWGRVALVRLEEGWAKPEAVASILEGDVTQAMKFAVLPGGAVEATLDRVPAFASLWDVVRQSSPTWLSGLSAEGGVGPLAEVGLRPEPGPGITVLLGGAATGKSLLLACASAAANGLPSPVEAEFTDGAPRAGAAGHSPAAGPVRDADPATDLRMRPFRRLMGYGAPDGSLFLPIALEGNAFRAFERVGRALLACAEAPDVPGAWPGLLLDVPLSAGDDVRRCKLAEVVVRLAHDRQVVVTTRDTGEARLWETIAAERGVPCATVDLRGGRAILAGAGHPAPGPR